MTQRRLVIGVETGCYIDGSHMNSIDFSLAVIDLAVDRGFEIDNEQYNKDKEWLTDSDDDEDKYFDILDSLDWTCIEAIDYLNETAPADMIWFVEDQSLFLEESED